MESQNTEIDVLETKVGKHREQLRDIGNLGLRLVWAKLIPPSNKAYSSLRPSPVYSKHT